MMGGNLNARLLLRICSIRGGAELAAKLTRSRPNTTWPWPHVDHDKPDEMLL